MRTLLRGLHLLGLLAILLTGESDAFQSFSARLRTDVLPSGVLSLAVTVSRSSPANAAAQCTSYTQSNLVLFALPVSIPRVVNAVTRRDISVQQLTAGRNYSLYAAILPTGSTSFEVAFDSYDVAQEVTANRSRLEFDFSYSFMGASERNLISSGQACAYYDIEVHFPKVFDPTELSSGKNSFIEVAPQTFFCPRVFAKTDVMEPIWIGFPSPSESHFHQAVGVVSLLLGLFAVSAQRASQRPTKLREHLKIIGLCVLFVALLGFYALRLARKTEFLWWAIGTVPPILSSLWQAVYGALGERFQAVIRGCVMRGQFAAQLATVTLLIVDDDGTTKEQTSEDVERDGSYVVRVWCLPWARPVRRALRVTCDGAVPQTSGDLSLKAGDKREVSFNLQLKEPAAPSPTVQGSSEDAGRR